MAKKPDPKTVKSGPLTGMFSVSSISRWAGDKMAPLRNWVQYGEAGTEQKDGSASKIAEASSANSLTATATASKLKILCTRITELEIWGTISKIRAKRDREFYEGRLGRNPVGRRVGSGYVRNHLLDRMEKIIEDGGAEDFRVASRMVAKEEGLEPNSDQWDSLIRWLRRHWNIRHPDNNS